MNRRTIESMADAAEPMPPTDAGPATRVFRPFPVQALPEPLRRMVVNGSTAIGCDPSFIALPLLAAVASAVGTTRRIQLKPGWTEPAILWTCIVGRSGSMKSPAIELAVAGVRKRQRAALADHDEAMATHREAVVDHERRLAEWKKQPSDDGPPAAPVEPVADRCWTDDTTIEALASLLARQPRGLLMIRDELSGWIADFGRYSGGRGGGDASRWLEMYGGRPTVVDRKTSATISVPAASVSIAGGIQPKTLCRALKREYVENGLAARLLMAWPPSRTKRWTDRGIAPADQDAVHRVLDRLYTLAHGVDESGEAKPQIVGMTPEAKRIWVDFYDAHALEQADLDDDLSAVWSKLEACAARLALVVHCARWAAGDPSLALPDTVDEASIAAGVDMARWFGDEARRIYAMLDESDDERSVRELVELIRRNDGAITTRELMRKCRKYPTAEGARAALDDLVASGMGSWDRSGGGKPGRPSGCFRLNEPDSCDNSHAADAVAMGIVSVNGVADADDWGEL